MFPAQWLRETGAALGVTCSLPVQNKQLEPPTDTTHRQTEVGGHNPEQDTVTLCAEWCSPDSKCRSTQSLLTSEQGL